MFSLDVQHSLPVLGTPPLYEPGVDPSKLDPPGFCDPQNRFNKPFFSVSLSFVELPLPEIVGYPHGAGLNLKVKQSHRGWLELLG